VRKVLRILRADGWEVVRQKGSHRQLQHESKPGTVTVAGKAGESYIQNELRELKGQFHSLSARKPNPNWFNEVAGSMETFGNNMPVALAGTGGYRWNRM
jgi:predicted RNA binding protein YcfA (HicA-like mRNA interferase family)